MKKVLFAAGLVALATSCTQDDFLSLGSQNEVRGVTFQAVEAVDSRVQYNQEEGSWAPFWYAESDRVNVWSNGTVLGATTVDGADTWTTLANKAIYKATKSAKNAQFTSISDANLVKFNVGDKKGAKFFVVYPDNENVTLTADAATPKTAEVDTLILTGALNGLATQTVETAMGQNKAIVQLAHASATQEQVYEAVGEKMNLTFGFATPVVKFGTKGLTEEFQKAFGKLSSIVVANQGYTDKKDSKKNIAATPMTYIDGAQILVDTKDWNHKIVAATSETEKPATSITVTVNSKWSDSSLAPIAIAEANRAAYVKAGVKETIKTTMTFEYIDLVDSRETDKNFEVGGNFLAITIDMADYPWMVTKTNRTLFVNSGDFSDMLNEDADAIVWEDTNATEGEVAFTDIKAVVVAEGVVLDAEDFKVLNKMTNVTSLTLKGNTSIPADALNALKKLTVINLPLVTSVGTGALSKDAQLAEVYMPSYEFNEGVNSILLNKAYLTKLSIGASNMNAGFPANGLILTDFAKLTEITVKNGVKVGSNVFKGCKALTKVTGLVDVVGTDVFNGCKVLNNVVIANKNVNDGTFNGCLALNHVYYMNDKTDLVPNKVGSYAFANTQIGKYTSKEVDYHFDLSATTTIGANAFEGVANLVGTTYLNQPVVKVGATSVAAAAFKGCTGIQFIWFANATTIGEDLLNGASALKEIKFSEAFTLPWTDTDKVAPSELTFGTSANVKLFINEAQTGVEGNVLTLGTAKYNTEFSFDQISVEE